jgi:hypothetical protein
MRFMRMMSLLVREQLRGAARSSLAAYVDLWAPYACAEGSLAAAAGRRVWAVEC